MIKISNLHMPINYTEETLYKKSAKQLQCKVQDINNMKVLKKSLDSRRKSDIHYSVTVAADVNNEQEILQKSGLESFKENLYVFPYNSLNGYPPAVIVGAGPCGLFAALMLARNGLKCILIEQGKCIEKRTADVENFWCGGELDETSNVQYGEGGAGTFSDGKLTCGVNDSRIPFVLKTFCDHGAPKDITYLAKPHIGTDKLKGTVASIRKELLDLGCEIRFETKLVDITVSNGTISAVTLNKNGHNEVLPCNCLIAALGNSARDTFRLFNKKGLAMKSKNFSVGVRIEHLQKDVNIAQYGNLPTLGTLPASDYKLAVHLENGRSVYSFCVCPGGKVVAAASKKGTVVTNGMSEYARNETNINGGMLVGVSDADYGDGLFDGMDFQQRLEEAAFAAGGGNYYAPAQLVGDFLSRRPSTNAGKIKPSYRPGVTYTNLWNILPHFVCEAIEKALPEMDKKVHGFANPDAVLTAVETRSSSPVRILRDENGMSNIKGIFPAGEGAGYAGGITSAAVDGIRAAEAVAKWLQNK